jgi:hypothetical protein
MQSFDSFLACYVDPHQTRTTAIILITSMLHEIILMGVTFYLPLYYQVLGASAIGAGVRMIPYSFGNAILSAIVGIVVGITGKYRPAIWICWVIMLLGLGLMTMLSETSNK